MATSRQLAAIMFTDIVGYTSLMGRDEKNAVDLLRANRNLHKRFITQFNGKLLKEMGDGILASFPTITDAVNYADSIQKEATQIDNLNLRLGIHQGEILLEGEDIYGMG
jgi:adenylate cyclase